MSSPFPGMDPYLEAHWRDVHHRLVTYAADDLQRVLPRDLRARVDERVFVDTSEGGRSIYPDVRVVERRMPAATGSQGGTALLEAVAQPFIVRLEDDSVSEGFIRIVDTATGHRLVTSIEFLSPANKTPGAGQDLYRKKQQEVLGSGASLVEIDLLRSGQWVMSVPLRHVPGAIRSTYCVCVRRGWQPERGEIYPVPLRERLPVIPVPLRETDADVPLDLQRLLDTAYENGAYDDLDYAANPVPPLAGEEAAWAEALLRAKGLRP
jgi:hypothetical protein